MRLARSRVHFVGIGGIGMSGLAELLFEMGAQVSGSDCEESVQTEDLRHKGITVLIGHSEGHIETPDVVVYSSAIPENNPELCRARELKVPLIPRAEALAEIMGMYRGVAVAGTHGKTTTTSLLASLFISAGEDPTVVVGGRLDLFQSTAKRGRGEWMIVEADESDGSFHRLCPEVVLITNIGEDHLNYYGNFENIQKAFYEFALRVPFYGTVIACGDDHQVRRLFERFPKKILFYGFSDSNDYFLKNDKDCYEVFCMGRSLGHFKPPLPGRYNALNALAAFVAARSLGLSEVRAFRGLESFQGVERRFQHKGCCAGVDFYDDYGHHPTEVRAVLDAFSEEFPERRLVVVFQPHRYTRTRDCWSQFVEFLSSCSDLFILDVYPAGEAPIEGFSSERLSREVEAIYLGDWSCGVLQVGALLNPGDICLTLGAGDIWKFGENLMRERRREDGLG